MAKSETGKIQIYLEPDMKMNVDKTQPAGGSPPSQAPSPKPKKTTA
jgi:hypothetical protein